MNTILVLLKVVYGYPLHMLAYYLTTIIYNIVCSLIAIEGAKKNTPYLKTKPLYFMIIYDMLFFQVLRIFFFLKGTITYYFDNQQWHKVGRTNNCYKV